MNSIYSLLIWFLFYTSTAFAGESIKPTVLPNTSYKGGEALKYQLRYGFIIGGVVNIDITEENFSNNPCFHIKGVTHTSGLADKIYRVNDIYESFIDPVTAMPFFAIRDIKEGNYKYHNEVHYNRSNNTLISQRSGEHAVPENILDISSAFYMIRRIDLSKLNDGDIINLTIFFSDKLFPFYVRYKGKEFVNTKWGYIKCHKFAPVVEPGRVFKTKDDMYIWYTDDKNCIPILVSMEMLVGKVYCELIDYKNLVVQPHFVKKK